MKTTGFIDDINRGKIKEKIFKKDFLDFLNINYVDVSGRQQYQIIDSDYLTKIGLCEIKSYKNSDESLSFEDYTNINETLGKKSFGWIYKTKADLIIFIDETARTMIILPMTDKFREYYESIKDNYKLKHNFITVHNDRKWQSAYRKLPLKSLIGYFSVYQKK